MKILYLCFTPYHIKASNFLSRTEYKFEENYIILSSCSGIKENTLEHFVEHSNYINKSYIDVELSLRQCIKEGVKYFKKFKKNIETFMTMIYKEKFDKIVYFSDNPIAYQILFNDIKEKNKNIKLRFVEEGTGIYLKKYHYPIRYYILIFISKIIFRNKKIRVFMHGKGGFEDEVLLREPDLIESSGKKIKLSKESFRKIMIPSYFTNTVSLERAAFFCPSLVIKDYKTRDRVFNEVFCHYYRNEKMLYVKLHPSEKNTESLNRIIENYNKYVKLIDRNDLTSEDILLNPNIYEVISDVSSTLINAYYLRDDIRLVSNYNLLIKKYKVKFKFQYSIFDNMIDNGSIESFMNY